MGEGEHSAEFATSDRQLENSPSPNLSQRERDKFAVFSQRERDKFVVYLPKGEGVFTKRKLPLSLEGEDG